MSVVLLVINTLIIILRIRIPGYYQKETLNIAVLSEGMLMWISLCSIIQGFVKKTKNETDIMGIIYFLIGIPLFNIVIVQNLLA